MVAQSCGAVGTLFQLIGFHDIDFPTCNLLTLASRTTIIEDRHHEDLLHWSILILSELSLSCADLALQILKNETKPAVELCMEKDLSSYSRFTRNKSVIHLPIHALRPFILGSALQSFLLSDFGNSYGEFMTLFSKTVAERTRPGQRQDVEEQGRCRCYHATGYPSLALVYILRARLTLLRPARLHFPRLRPNRGRCRHHHLRQGLPGACSASATFQDCR